MWLTLFALSAWAAPPQLRMDHLLTEPLAGQVGPAALGFARSVPSLPEGLEVHSVIPLGGPAGPLGYGPRGATVQLRATLDGVPVHALTLVRLDPQHRVRQVLVDSVPQDRVQGQPLPMASLLPTIEERFPGAQSHARLRWRPVGSQLRQVWTFDLTLAAPHPELTAPRVHLDALTGKLLGIEEGAALEEVPVAEVYTRSPTHGELISVELPLATEGLSDDRLTVYQCADHGQVNRSGYRECTEELARGPYQGDYLFLPEPYAVTPGVNEDDFVAANVYHHVHQGLDWFEALGWVPNDGFLPHIDVTVNRRVADTWTEASATSPRHSLAPYNNAYSGSGYTDYEGNWVPPVLVFGQGSSSDYGYDADVIYHELTHYIVKSQAGPSYSPDTLYGPSVRAGSLNEGLADYFAAAIVGQPELGDYAAGPDRDFIRTLEGQARCGQDLYGETHYDSQPFSQPLWAFRQTLGAEDQTTLDEIVLDSLSLMGTTPTFDSAEQTLLDLVDERLGDASALAAGWDAVGLSPCLPVVPITPLTAFPTAEEDPTESAFRSFTLVPPSYSFLNKGPVPGYLQFQVEVPEGGAELTLRLTQYEYLGWDPYVLGRPQPLGVVAQPGELIEWTQEERTIEEEYYGEVYTFTVYEWVTEATPQGELQEVDTYLHEEGEYMVHVYEGSFTAAQAGRFVFQLTNAYQHSASPADLTLVMGPIPPQAEEDTGALTTEPLTEPNPVTTHQEPTSCSCTSSPSLAWWWWPGMLLGLRARRSSHGQPR